MTLEGLARFVENGQAATAAIDRAMPSPYARALAHIERHPGSGGAVRLAKLLLSLWNGDDCGFSFRECIESLDDERTQLALQCVARFASRGEDDELVRIGHRVHELYPRVWDLGIAARDAKGALRATWDAEYEREIEAEEREAERRQRDEQRAGR